MTTLPEGHFLLYSHIAPALKAGSYRFTASQELSATGPDGAALDSDDLDVADLAAYVDVTSPRYQLPPDQVLSTYPPASSEGSYGSRLPQVVIKRRTLPWERDAGVGDDLVPWLALVVIAEGEAELVLNRPVAECFTPGLAVEGTADVPQGNYLQVRKSVIDKVFPTQKDVPLLAHARQVDINDTELMMGDDDGFLAVVIANRLPVPGHTPAGDEVPVKYLACLVNLEGQLPRLLPEAPPPVFTTVRPIFEAATAVISAAEYDHVAMGLDPAHTGLQSTVLGIPHADTPEADRPDDAPLGDAPHAAAAVGSTAFQVSPDTVAVGQVRAGHWDLVGATSAAAVYEQMAAPFVSAPIIAGFLDPSYRFPVLLHWSFTSTGQTTFQTLMEDLDNGLLGTLPGVRPFGDHADDPDRTPQQLDGRPPLEVVETGHVGLAQRTRRGDQVRAWYRGPLLPHPADTSAPRLPLAHASDQLRTVIPDGREDLSLAAAFEIGRLLALSSPSMISALMRWRQDGFEAARRETVWGPLVTGITTWLGTEPVLAPDLGVLLGRGLAAAVTKQPGDVLGQPRALLTPGTALPVDGLPLDIVAKGYGVEALGADLSASLGVLRATTVPRLPLADLGAGALTGTVRDVLGSVLDGAVSQLTVDALAPTLDLDPVLGPTFVGFQPRDTPHRDALDEALESGPKEDES